MCALPRLPPTKRAAVACATVAPAKKAQVAAPLSRPKKAVAPAPAVHPNGPTVPAVRPMDMVLEIVGTAKADCGHRCEEHSCGKVLEEDVVIRLRREQIFVPNRLGSGHREETAYTVNWVTDGQDCCRVGFLPRFYVAQGGLFDGVLCQVVSVGQEFDDDVAERAKWKHSCGYARAQVISPLNKAG
jgi:hypothetical protein